MHSCISTPSKNEVQENVEHEVNGEAQGTTYTVKYIGQERPSLKEEIDDLLLLIDQSMSTYIPHSLISQLNEGDSAQIDEMFMEVYRESEQISKLTDGAFDPTIAPIIKAWGFDYSDPTKMDSSVVNELLQFCGFKQFELNGSWLVKRETKARLNFNAIAQGYSVDLMAGLLDSLKIENYFVELGGEVKVKGKNKDEILWRVGIDSPSGKNLERKLAAIVSLEDQAMVTSGNYRKYIESDGERYYHTINPKTGFPIRHKLLSTTIIANKTSEADALATAFMVMGMKKSKAFLEQHSGYQAVLIFENKQGQLEVYYSPSLKNRVEVLSP